MPSVNRNGTWNMEHGDIDIYSANHSKSSLTLTKNVRQLSTIEIEIEHLNMSFFLPILTMLVE